MALRLTPQVEGNEAGETIVFIQGWPDDASLWDPCVAALRDKYRSVRVTLPNYGGDRTSRWGYDTLEIVDALEQIVIGAALGSRVTLVMHDWGCYWGHAVHRRRPDLVARVVGIDVAPHFRPPSAGAVLGIIGYQWWLLGAFVAGGPVGDWMSRSIARLAQAPADSSRISAWMNYPYRNVWADLVSGRRRELEADYWPTCPLLFVFGKDKPFPFHSDEWTDHVKKVGGEVVGLSCGHWVPSQPEFVALLTRWLSNQATKASPQRQAAESSL